LPPKERGIVIVATHPIQYQVPWFKALTRTGALRTTVLYALLPDDSQQGVGFNRPFQWDIPMFGGYEWKTLPNARKEPSLRGFFSSSTPSIRKVLAQDRPEAVIITGWNSWPLLQALWACVSLGIPAIIRGESNSLRRRPWWVRLAHRLLLSRYQAFLAIGQANRHFYLGYGVTPSRIFDCPYFVDNERIRAQFETALPRHLTLRGRWGIDPEVFCFLYVGKLEPKKRIFDLLEAFRIACATLDGLHLLVVGSGELEESARTWAANSKLPITYAGFLNQSELTEAYVAGDCLVLPSDFGETWGLVVNEAMVCGLPAIVSDRVGCGRDLVSPAETGMVFPFGDTAVLADCLVNMASDRAAAGAMGERARIRIASYSVESAASATVEAIQFVTHAR